MLPASSGARRRHPTSLDCHPLSCAPPLAAGDQTKIDTELTGKSWYLCSSPASDEKTEAWFSRVRAACEGVAAPVADEPGKTMKEMQAPRRTHTARRASIALF